MKMKCVRYSKLIKSKYQRNASAMMNWFRKIAISWRSIASKVFTLARLLFIYLLRISADLKKSKTDLNLKNKQLQRWDSYFVFQNFILILLACKRF